MIEAAMIWNEPNNKSHWDPEIDPDWMRFSQMAILAADAIAAENPALTTVLGGMSPIDPAFCRMLEQGRARPHRRGRRARLPARLEPVADPRMAGQDRRDPRRDRHAGLGVARSASRRSARRKCRSGDSGAPPNCWSAGRRASTGTASSTCRRHGPRPPATARRRALPITAISTWACCARTARPSPRWRNLPGTRRRLGICQWFHFEDPRLDDAVAWLKRLGVSHLRTGLSWADSFRPNALAWFDRQMEALAGFDVTVTFCFTPEHRGIVPHHTSPPLAPEEFAEFCAAMIRRYAPAHTTSLSQRAEPVGG